MGMPTTWSGRCDRCTWHVCHGQLDQVHIIFRPESLRIDSVCPEDAEVVVERVFVDLPLVIVQSLAQGALHADVELVVVVDNSADGEDVTKFGRRFYALFIYFLLEMSAVKA